MNNFFEIGINERKATLGEKYVESLRKVSGKWAESLRKVGEEEVENRALALSIRDRVT